MSPPGFHMTSQRRYLVTPHGFDNIGKVLGALGPGFNFGSVGWTSLQQTPSRGAGSSPDGGALDNCEVLFVNCAGESSAWNGSAGIIRRFVENGGSLYASDLAAGLIEAEFPGQIDFDRGGVSGAVACETVDPGLAEVIGGRISIHFDMGHWARIINARDARVYLRTSQRGAGASKGQPIVVSFRVGRGHVIYTSFHNSAQTSEQEHKLLRYLVFRPMLARAATDVSDRLRAQQYAPGTEVISSVDQSGGFTFFRYDVSANQSIACILQWEENGTLELVVKSPDGAIAHQTSGTRPPLEFESPTVVAGPWLFGVRAVSVPHDNFPFVLAISSRAAGNQANSTRTIKPLRKQAPTRNSYTQRWTTKTPGCVVVLVDQSDSMREPFNSGSAGEGKRKCDVVADILNALLADFQSSNRRGDVVLPRVDLAVIAYEGSGVQPLLGGNPGGKTVVSVAELGVHIVKIETRSRMEISDDGAKVVVPTQFPIWVEPHIGSSTPMCAALARAYEVADAWSVAHPTSYPPIIINITDGASTDGDPGAQAEALKSITTEDGSVLLFNCHVSRVPGRAIEFPEIPPRFAGGEDDLAGLLFRIASVLPKAAREEALRSTGVRLGDNARGFIFNGDALAIRRMFSIGTIAARIDPNR